MSTEVQAFSRRKQWRELDLQPLDRHGLPVKSKQDDRRGGARTKTPDEDRKTVWWHEDAKEALAATIQDFMEPVDTDAGGDAADNAVRVDGQDDDDRE
jgi:hypothetical protein